jgi:BirA family transcriptional regulator, biotin operon repressor / biotin---[acetyl-CoA-carboxylase] ligase
MTVFTIERVAEVDSTNTVLMNRAAKSACHGNVLVADNQSGGRGQRGRRWSAAPGDAILCSVAWQFPKATPLDGLSLAVGVMLAEALDGWLPTTTLLKWPNDLLVALPEAGLRKIGGILIETVASPDAKRTAVIGFGINVRSTPPHDALAPGAIAAACLDDVAQSTLDRDVVLTRLLHTLEAGLTQFAMDGFSAFQPRWWQRRAFAEDAVVARLPDGSQLVGKITAVTERGALVLQSASGLHTLISGEVSVRGFGA